jgi:hypothetical protein
VKQQSPSSSGARDDSAAFQRSRDGGELEVAHLKAPEGCTRTGGRRALRESVAEDKVVHSQQAGHPHRREQS